MANVLIFRQKNLISDADTDVPPPPWPPHSSVLLVHPVVCPVHPVSAVYWEGRGYITLHLHHGPPLPTHATCSCKTLHMTCCYSETDTGGSVVLLSLNNLSAATDAALPNIMKADCK